MKEALISEGRLMGQLMNRHRGKSKGASIKQLAYALTGEESTPSVERHIRKLVVEMRNRGIPVGSCPSQGYFLAESEQDLEDTIRNLEDRAKTTLRQLSALKKMALPELLGQMGLDEQGASHV